MPQWLWYGMWAPDRHCIGIESHRRAPVTSRLPAGWPLLDYDSHTLNSKTVVLIPGTSLLYFTIDGDLVRHSLRFIIGR